MNNTLSCIYTIPHDEKRHRMETLQPNNMNVPVHRSNKNDLNQTKDIIIQSMYLQKQWNTQKKRVNIYEKFNTYPNGIINHKTASRAFFKMYELSSYIGDFLYQQKPLSFLSLAEAPGGFIQALCELREHHPLSREWSLFDIFYGNTLQSSCKKNNNPKWSPLVMNKPKIKLFYSNINDIDDTVKSLKYVKRFDMITADCGIDVSDNFHKQENMMYSLLIKQIIIMLQTIQRHGIFILKIFETDNYHTKELLYLLGCIFRQVILTKPRTSRPLNSEKYIICRNFVIPDSIKFNLIHTLINYVNRDDFSKGTLWNESIPEDCMFLFHSYSRYCKEITRRHLKLILKKIDDNGIKLQYDVAKEFANEYNLPIYSV